MECFRNWISLKGCSIDAPDSGRYVNELPGVSLESVDKLSNSEQITYVKVWNDIVNRSLVRFENRIIAAFSKRFKKKSVKQSVNLGKIIDLVNSQSAALDQYRGFSLELISENQTPFVQSTLFGISWQTFALYLKSVPASAFTLKLWDMETKDVLWSITLNNAANPVAVGWNTIKVNEIFFSSLRLFAGFDSDEIAVPYMKMLNTCSCDGLIRGAVTQTKTDPSVLTYSENSFGLSAVFSIVCSFQALICDNKRSFTDAWMYQLGEELMTERLFSDRWNWWTLDREQAEKMKLHFNEQTDENINIAVDGIDLDLNDDCLECGDQVTINESIP